MAILHTALLAQSTSTTTRRTSPCAYFHDHGIYLPRVSSPSSHIFPTMCAPVNPLGVSQFDNLWSKLLALTTEFGKGQSKHPREAIIHIAQERFLLRELDIVAQDSALLRKRDAIQDLHAGLTYVLTYNKPGLACAFLHQPPPLRGLHQTSFATSEGPR